MATFSSQPEELLSHILKLSTEGDPPWAQQRARFSFGLVSRACYRATANATDYYIAGSEQAKALTWDLENEKIWAAQKERKAKSGRAARACASLIIPRAITIRRLAVSLGDNGIVKSLANLLRFVGPNLSALELNIGFMYGQQGNEEEEFKIAAWYGPLVAALEGVERLRTLHIVSSQKAQLSSEMVMRLLIPLASLEVLYLNIGTFDVHPHPTPAILAKLALPRLRQLVVDKPPSSLVWKMLFDSAPELDTLHLTCRDTEFFSDLSPLVPQLAHFSWTPPREGVKPQRDARDALLKLVGEMTSLESLVIPLWTLEYYGFEWGTLFTPYIPDIRPEPQWDLQPIDRTPFDVLATLPRLRTVNLVARIGKLEESDVTRFIKAVPSLQNLTIFVRRSGGWTSEQVERVCAAGEKAGVVFTYKRDSAV